MDKYLLKLKLSYQNTDEERKLSELLFTEPNKTNNNIVIGDQRLNSIAALTYNAASSDRIFAMLEKAIVPTDNPWYTIHRALLVLRTIVLYGSEKAIDSSIQITRYVYMLQDYNSALVKKSRFSLTSGGTDYGAPVRAEAKILVSILSTDESIRNARIKAREGQASLVPIGDLLDTGDVNETPEMHFGQGIDSFVGAKFSLEAVPGIYEGRPDRYFDNLSDPRNGNIQTGDHQFTRDAQAPDLLDLSFDSVASSNLPEAQYLPALEKQRELENQLAKQREELELLRRQQSQPLSNNVIDLLGQSAPVYQSQPPGLVYSYQPTINQYVYPPAPQSQYPPQQLLPPYVASPPQVPYYQTQQQMYNPQIPGYTSNNTAMYSDAYTNTNSNFNHNANNNINVPNGPPPPLPSQPPPSFL